VEYLAGLQWSCGRIIRKRKIRIRLNWRLRKLISIIRNIKDRVTKGFFLMLEIGVGLICLGALIVCLVLLYMNSKGGL
jgi:hypothetical protein